MRLVSVGLDGAPAGQSGAMSLTADGLTMGFVSSATNLVANDTNAASDVFVAAARCP